MTLELNQEKAKLFLDGFKPVNTAKVGDYLVQIHPLQTVCEDIYCDAEQRIRYSINTIYSLRRITKVTKTSVYTRADPGENHNGAYYMRFQGNINCLATVFPPDKNIICPVVVTDLLVRSLYLPFLMSPGFDIRVYIKDTSVCLGYDPETSSSEIGCERFTEVYYTNSHTGISRGFCKTCWMNRAK